MIVPMKHLTIIVLDAKRKAATRDLETLGVVHVSRLASQSVDIDALRQQEVRVRRALAFLGDSKVKESKQNFVDFKTLEELLEAINHRGDRIKVCQDEIDGLSRELDRIAVWGDFNPEDIIEFGKKNLNLGLVGIPDKQLKKIDPSIPLYFVNKAKGKTFFLTPVNPSDYDASWEVFTVPEMSSREMKQKIESLRKEVDELRLVIGSLSGNSQVLEKRLEDIGHEIECAQVEAGMAAFGSLAVIEGFVPADRVASIKTWAQKNQWGIAVRDPEPGENVPTILHNSKPVAILKPVLDFLGTLPGYHERDISPWFLFFLIVFFSMIIGDAAYGTLFLAVSVIASVVTVCQGKKIHPALKLLCIFSVGTIIWGAMSGSWLALEGAKEVPFLRALMIPALVNQETSKATVLIICFVLGLLHLNLAHVLRFIREVRVAPHIHAIAQAGWAMVINGAFFLVLNIVVDPVRFPVPQFAIWFIVAGMAAVLIFEKQEGDNFFKGILRSLANIITTALSGVSAFADVISYVRLFAVGLAGLAIEQSFNSMALPMMESGGIAVVGGVLIMAFGHSLNLVMGALSVIVHGIRLNMLEFSSHTGLEWAGIPYKPFKEKN